MTAGVSLPSEMPWCTEHFHAVNCPGPGQDLPAPVAVHGASLFTELLAQFSSVGALRSVWAQLQPQQRLKKVPSGLPTYATSFGGVRDCSWMPGVLLLGLCTEDVQWVVLSFYIDITVQTGSKTSCSEPWFLCFTLGWWRKTTLWLMHKVDAGKLSAPGRLAGLPLTVGSEEVQKETAMNFDALSFSVCP